MSRDGHPSGQWCAGLEGSISAGGCGRRPVAAMGQRWGMPPKGQHQRRRLR